VKMIPLIAGLVLALSTASVAQTTNAPLVPNAPTIPSISSTDVFQDVVGGFPQAQSQYATAAQVGVYGTTLQGGNANNALIGGDFSTNLFQRGASVSTAGATYYVAYGADRWFTWGGTSTPTTMTQQTGATDIPANASASYRINKGSLTGTAQICTSQIIESQGVYQFQGQTAEFTFDAKAGPTFSAALSNLAVYVSYGTVADQSSTLLAYGLNALGGAGTTAWTGQVNLGGTGGFLIPINTAWNRYGVAVPIPTTAIELAVSICYTPVGTGTATDWFEFGKAQLTVNPALTTAAGTSGVILNTNDVRTRAFARRPQQVETALQQRYYYQLTETTAITPIATCAVSTTSLGNCLIPFPVPMRIVPTMGYTTGWGMTVGAQTSVVACLANATVTSVTSTAVNTLAAAVTCTSSTGFGAAGTVAWLYGGQGSHTGIITVSAEE